VIEPHPAASGLLDQLDARADEIGRAMAEAILGEVAPMQAVSRNDPSFRARFELFCAQHVRAFVATTRQGRVAGAGDLGFVREVAERRADDAFPLPELMEGLRVGHRVLSRRIAQLGSGWDTPAATVLWTTSRLVDYMDATGTVLADSYRARQKLSAGRTQLARREMLDDILEGRFASRPDAALVAASVGFEPDELYCVVVLVASGDPLQHTQLLASDLARAAISATGLRFVVTRGDEVAGIFRAAHAAEVVSQAMQGYGARSATSQARAGLSTTCRGIAEVARGYWEAVRALRYTSPAEPCIDLRRLGPLRYLEFSADSVARRLAVQCAGPLALPSARRLADTVLAYIECGQNARETADHLGVHLNTVHNRLARIEDLFDHRVDLIELATALRICRAADA
jgi:PucR C-terminal helix-turn-helix domain/GGDEF-like domain